MWWFFTWFVMNKMINCCLRKTSVVHVVVQRRTSEDEYTGNYEVLLVWWCVKLYLYVGLYDNVDVSILYKVGFSWCAVIYIKIKVIFIHWFICSRKKQFDKHTVFLLVIESSVHIQWKYLHTSFISDTQRNFCMKCCHFYVKTWVICNHMVICVCINKISEEHKVFLRLVDADIRSKFSYIGYLRGFDKAYYTNHVIFSHNSFCVDHWFKWNHENCKGKGVCSVLTLD